jgi:hypothetical protein
MKNKVIYFALIGWLLGACAAIPTTVQLPLLEEKGDLVASAQTYVLGLSGNLMYAPTNHLGLSLGGGFHDMEWENLATFSYKQIHGEMGIHGFYRLNSVMVINCSALGTTGKTGWTDGLLGNLTANFNANVYRFAFQPSFRYQPGKFYISGAFRLSNWKFNHVHMVYYGKHAMEYQEAFENDPNLVNPTMWSNDIAFQFGYWHGGLGGNIQFLFSNNTRNPFAAHSGFSNKGFNVISVGLSFAPIALMNR